MRAAHPFEPGLIDRLEPAPQKVAVLRAGRIGDFLCAVPAFQAVRARLPEAEITLITLPMLVELAQRVPPIDRIVEFPGYPGLAEQFFEPGKAVRFFQAMQAEHFDLAIQMQGSGVNSNPFMLMLGARATAGFVRPGDGAGRLAAALPIPESGHEIERILALTRFLGAPRQGNAIPLALRQADHQAAEQLLGEARRPLIGIHPAARDQTRRWAVEKFAQAGRALVRATGGSLVLIGEAAERETGEQVIAAAGVPAQNLAGQTSLPVLAALLARLDVLLTNDTGPAHLGYALNTPVVTVVGGSDPQRYGPHRAGPFRLVVREIDCRPCNYAACPIGMPCLEEVTVEQVVAAAFQVMRGKVERAARGAPDPRRGD